jgi:hypothetical protein
MVSETSTGRPLGADVSTALAALKSPSFFFVFSSWERPNLRASSAQAEKVTEADKIDFDMQTLVAVLELLENVTLDNSRPLIEFCDDGRYSQRLRDAMSPLVECAMAAQKRNPRAIKNPDDEGDGYELYVTRMIQLAFALGV